MKKLLIALFMSCAILTSASAEVGVKIGVAAQIGSMEASGKEANSDGATATRTSNTREALFGTGGFFIEKDFIILMKSPTFSIKNFFNFEFVNLSTLLNILNIFYNFFYTFSNRFSH